MAGAHRTAPLGRRLVAYLMDMVLVYGVYAIAVGAVRGAAAGTDVPPTDRESMIIGLATAVAQFVYFVGMWAAVRGSLGQRILGLMVVRESGDRLPLVDCVARWAVLQGPLALALALPEDWFQIGSLALAVWTAVLLWSVRSDELGRGYQDRIAGSRVILQP
jgi:uncharacterized RDD family membrane protein YckC